MGLTGLLGGYAEPSMSWPGIPYSDGPMGAEFEDDGNPAVHVMMGRRDFLCVSRKSFYFIERTDRITHSGTVAQERGHGTKSSTADCGERSRSVTPSG